MLRNYTKLDIEMCLVEFYLQLIEIFFLKKLKSSLAYTYVKLYISGMHA